VDSLSFKVVKQVQIKQEANRLYHNQKLHPSMVLIGQGNGIVQFYSLHLAKIVETT